MPRVGKKHFSYDDAGYAAAQAEADRTGKSMITGYARGGSVDDLLEEGARTVSDADRRKLARDYEKNSRAANRDFEYDRASYELDQNAGRSCNRLRCSRRTTNKYFSRTEAIFWTRV